MIEIRQQEYEGVEEFKNEIINSFAEALGRELSLEGVALHTFGYQAPAYYEARGYVEHMVILGKTRERDRIYFQKKLQGN